MKYLRFSWVVALVATLGSLYFSEVKHFIPCTLCWFQRILMYPLSIILAIAFIRNDKNIAYYVLPISILGMMFSGYHYMEQKIPAVASIKPCTVGIPCTTEWINWFGFITIPFLALTAFTLITVTLIIIIKKDKKQNA